MRINHWGHSAMLSLLITTEAWRIAVVVVLIWLIGMFFGLGLEQKLLAPRRRKIGSKNTDDHDPNPLPMLGVEGMRGINEFRKPRTFVSRLIWLSKQANFGKRWFNKPSSPPASKAFNHEAPNVKWPS
jgi:hypothetical protein